MSSVFLCTASRLLILFVLASPGRLTKMHQVPSTSRVRNSALPSYLPSQPSPAFLNTHLVPTNFPPTSIPHFPLLLLSSFLFLPITHLTSSPSHPQPSHYFPLIPHPLSSPLSSYQLLSVTSTSCTAMNYTRPLGSEFEASIKVRLPADEGNAALAVPIGQLGVKLRQFLALPSRVQY